MQPDTATLVEIAHVYAIYARAIDEKRYDLLARVFTADATLHYVVGPHDFSCRGDDAAASFGAFLEYCYWTNHLIAAPMIETGIEAGREACHATARVTATHLQRRHEGTLSRWLVRGSYHDRFERRDGAWLIVNRECLCPDAEGEFLRDGVERYPGLAWADAATLA